MDVWILGMVSLAAGICASMGIGGGFVLLLYLTLVMGIPQREAQLMNLIFFLPIAGFSVFMHLKHKLLVPKVLLPAILGGIPGVFLGVYLVNIFSDKIVGKIFAGFILLIGLKELFFSKKSAD